MEQEHEEAQPKTQGLPHRQKDHTIGSGGRKLEHQAVYNGQGYCQILHRQFPHTSSSGCPLRYKSLLMR